MQARQQHPAPAIDKGQSYRFAHIPELDGLRGLAVLLVFLHHAIFTSTKPGGWSGAFANFRAWTKYGSYGVDVFFVLSGFLITSLVFVDRQRPSFLHNFYWKRVLRILPLLVVLLALIATFLPHSHSYALLSLLFVVNYANVLHVDPYIGPFWTLAIEEQFYLVWPQLSGRLSVRRVQWVALAVFFASSLLRLLASKTTHHNFAQTQFRVDGLALGTLLACQVCLHRIQSADPVRRPFWWRSIVLGLAVPGTLLLALGLGGRHSAVLGGATSEALLISATALLTASVIAFAVSHPGSKLLWALRTRVAGYFGLISYCFYLCHLYLLRLFDHWHGAIVPGDERGLAIRFLIVLGITIVASELARRFIEKPAFGLRRFVLRTGSEPAPKSAPGSVSGVPS